MAVSETPVEFSEKLHEGREKLAVTVCGPFIVTVVEALAVFPTFPLQLTKVYPLFTVAAIATAASLMSRCRRTSPLTCSCSE